VKVPADGRALAALAMAVALGSALISGACGQTRYAVRGNVRPAPVDLDIASLPGARGFWFPEPEYGGRIYVLVAGKNAPSRQAPTVVLVHGLGDAGVRDFYPLLAELGRERRIVTFDLPGFGRSDKANVKYAPDRFARVVSEVVTAFAEGPVDVVGHSMGGAISLLHAATFPAQVRHLVVIDAAGILHREAWVAQHLRRVTEPTGRVSPRVAEAMADAATMIVDASRLFGAAPDVILEVGFLRQKILRAEPGRIAALSLMLHDFGPALAHIEAPTLIVWGAKDVVAPLRTGYLLADRVPNARLFVIPEAGHVVMQDAPVPLLVEIKSHLAGPPAGAALAPLPIWPAAGDVAIAGVAGAGGREGVCRGTADVAFRGSYDSVVLEDCKDARLEEVRARRLVIKRSSASVVRSTFTEGIVADTSTLLMTGGGVDGAVAIEAKDSQLDLAGVAIATKGEACHMTGQTRVVYSVCPVRTASGLAYRHGFESSTATAPVAP